MLQSTKINASSIALQLLFSWSRDCCNLFSESFGCNVRKTFLISAPQPDARFTAIIWIEMGKNAFRALVFTITHSLRRVYWYAWTVFSHSHYRDKVSFLRPVIAISPLLYLKHHHFTGRASAEMMGQKNGSTRIVESWKNIHSTAFCTRFLLHLTIPPSLTHAIWMFVQLSALFFTPFFGMCVRHTHKSCTANFPLALALNVPSFVC